MYWKLLICFAFNASLFDCSCFCKHSFYVKNFSLLHAQMVAFDWRQINTHLVLQLPFPVSMSFAARMFIYIYFDIFIRIFKFPYRYQCCFFSRLGCLLVSFKLARDFLCAPYLRFDRILRTIVCHTKIEKSCFHRVQEFLYKQTRLNHDIVMFDNDETLCLNCRVPHLFFLCPDITFLSTFKKNIVLVFVRSKMFVSEMVF